MVIVENPKERLASDNLEMNLDGFNVIYKDIADEIGIENAISIYKMFHGTQISFPNRLFSKDYIHKAVSEEYNGENIAQLAQKCNYSERSIRRILEKHKNK